MSGPGDVLLRPPAMLALAIDAFEHPGPWSDSFTLVGPLAWEPPAEPPDWHDDDNRPLVLATTSSEFQNDARLAVTAVEALRDRSDVRVVITVPTGWTEQPVDVPEHVHLESFVPHGPLLARAAAVVCHGGAGISFMELAAGVPVVAVPFGRDQLEVAQRVVASGGGVALRSRRLSGRRLSGAVAAAERLRPRAGELAASADLAGGAALAACRAGPDRRRRTCASGQHPMNTGLVDALARREISSPGLLELCLRPDGLLPGRIVVVGGTVAVSSEVEHALWQLHGVRSSTAPHGTRTP